MKTSVEALSEVELKVEVEISSAEVDKEFVRQVGKVGKRARIKGFRPGKAPRAIIEKHYGSSISAETTRSLITRTLDGVLDSLERKPLGEPAIEPGVARQGEPLKYAVRVQVKPVVKIHSWEGIEVAVPPAVVEERQVDARIGELQLRAKERVPVEDRGADTRDIVVANLEGHLEGERDPRLDAREIEITIGEGRMIPGFEDQLMGARPGQELVVETAFPDDYHQAELAGRPARWDVAVTQVFTEELPDIDDDLAQDQGFESLDELRADIFQQLLRAANKQRDEDIEKRVMAVLLERNRFPLPPALQQAALQERAHQFMSLLQMQGMGRDQAMEIINSNIQDLARASDLAVRRQLALEAFADAQGIDVDDDEVSDEIVKRIQERGESAAKLYARSEMRETLRMEMIQRRAIDRIKAEAIVTDAAPDDTSSAEDPDTGASGAADEEKQG